MALNETQSSTIKSSESTNKNKLTIQKKEVKTTLKTENLVSSIPNKKIATSDQQSVVEEKSSAPSYNDNNAVFTEVLEQENSPIETVLAESPSIQEDDEYAVNFHKKTTAKQTSESISLKNDVDLIEVLYTAL